jgi:anti-sigma28 factor (negative regulator of flagellin synthesis)
MKIDLTRSGFSAPVESVKVDTPRQNTQADGPTATTDTVTLSSTVRQLADSIKTSPDAGVRSDVVDQARRLLDAGQVGNDLDSLADALLDAHGVNR